MKKSTVMTLTLISLLLLPANLLADAEKREWFGNWSMNHDGFAGTLRVSDLKVDCASSAWCDMAINYVDNTGVNHRGSIEKIDDNGQHMVFYINFPGNRQKFDAYIFSWDKQKLAGTTYWGGRTFGFYATKR
jgi:hypothetical protein